MDKFKESLSKILNSMVPGKESRQSMVDRFKEKFKTDPNTVILKKIALNTARSYETLQAIQRKLEDEEEPSFFQKLGGVLKNLGKGLLAFGAVTAAITGLNKLPNLISGAISTAFKAIGLNKLIPNRTPTPTPNMTRPGAPGAPGGAVGKFTPVRIMGPLPLPVKGLGGVGDMDVDRKGKRKGGAFIEDAKRKKALSKNNLPGADYDKKRINTQALAEEVSKRDKSKFSLADKAKGFGKGALSFAKGAGPLGLAITAATAGVDAVTGYSDEATKFNLGIQNDRELTFGEKLSSSAGSFLSGIADPFGVGYAPSDKIAKGIGNFFNVGPDTINQMNPKLEAQGVGIPSPVMIDQRTTSKTLQDQQTRTDVMNTTTQQGAPLNVVNSSTNNVVNNTQNMVNKTRPRNESDPYNISVYKDLYPWYF